jgi:hypothetical protein
MATKQVSVRLAATGGKQVEGELRGVGEAGEKAFKKIPREVQRANAKLAAFARGVKFAAIGAASAAAAGAVAATHAAMDRAFEVQKQAAVANADPEMFQGWAAGAETVGIEADKLSDILKDVNDRVGDFLQTGGGPMKDFFENVAPKVGVTAAQFAKLSGPEALQLYIASLEKAGASQQDMTFYLESMASDATALLPLLRDNGAQMTRLAERAADLGVVMDRKTIAGLNRSRTALVAVGQVMTGMGNKIGSALAPVLEGLAKTFVDLARSTGPIGRGLDALTHNIGRIMAYAGTFAALMAGKWVAGMAAAAAMTLRTAGALRVLKGALVRTGIGALVVGAGELVYWFSKLVSGAGGFGAALGLLKDVASEVWSKVSLSAQAAWAHVESSWATAQAGIYAGLQAASDGVVGWANSILNTFEGTFLGVQAIWESLPAVFDRIGALAINGLVEAMESGLEGLTSAVNSLLTLGGRRPEWAIPAPDLTEWKQTVPEAVSLGEAAREAYESAFADDPLKAPTLFDGMADDARIRASGYAEAARMLSTAASGPLTAWQALKDAMTGAGDEGADALDEAAASADKVTAALAAAGGAADGVKDKLTGWAAAKQSLKDYADTAMDFGKGVGGALVSAFQNAESAFRSFVETGKLDFKGLVRSILADLAVLAFKNAVLGPIANALSGVFGGGSTTAAVSHNGGMVGLSGMSRSVPAAVFAGAARMHSGGTVEPVGSWAGLRPDEVPTILQRGERVLNRREAAAYSPGGAAGGGVSISIDARGAQMGVAEQIEAKLQAALPEIKRVAIQSVSDRRQRGYAL